MSTRLDALNILSLPPGNDHLPKDLPKRARARENNFGAIRLFAALLVIYGHGLDMKGLPPPILWDTPVSLIGLFIFFSVSGYLIYDSWLRSPRLGSFLLKRALRIFPGLIVCVLVTIFGIGAFATTLPMRAYFSHHVTWQYLLNIALYLRLYLPGVFPQRLLYHAVNGSLWSLFPEVLCYLLVPLVCLAAVWARGVLLLAIMAACGGAAMYLFAYDPTRYGLIYSADPKYVLMLVPFFMAGAFWRQLQIRVPTLFRLDLAVAFTIAAFVLPMVLGTSSTAFRWLLFSYVILAFGRESSPVLREAARFGDLSYGAYLYAFPIQQLVLDHFHGFAISIATIATLVVALLSWHLVERPALRLKPRTGWRPDTELGLASTVAKPAGRPPRDWRAIGRSALRLAGTTALLPGIVTLLCLAAYAGQLALGRWQLDEYLLFTSLHSEGWHAIMPRLAFSPRPFSEALLFLYGAAVLAFGSPLVVPFLAALWVGVLGCAVLAARRVLPPSRWRLLTAAVLAGALFAFVLATNSITELFYWPMAAAAYLPTAGSAMVLLFLLSGPLDARARLGCGAALLVAAGSSEVGAALAVGFAGAAICAGVLDGRMRLVQSLRSGLWWLLPALLGLAVLAIVAAGRAHGIRPGAEAEPWAGHIVASTELGLRAFVLDLAAMNTPDRTVSLTALATKLLFALGFVAVWRQADPAGAAPGRWHAVLAAALGIAALFSIVAAYDHYGTLCCERQATTRSWFIDMLAIIAMAWAFARWMPWRRRVAWLAPVLLAISLYPVLYDLHGLRQDYAGYQWGIDARVRTWQSAAEAGTGPMEFYMSPDSADMLIHGYTQPIGTYAVGPDAPELVTAIGRFFGKDVVVTCQPWQTHQSWVINGQFIPACPPNAMPPRVVGSIAP
jgi:peptidoglycan/LPS O-acetylase OafA/YrhL